MFADGSVPRRISPYLPWVVAVSMVMEQLDSTILNTALPKMAAALHVTPLSLRGVVASYVLSLAVCIPVSGWIADRYGTRRVFTLAIGLFTASSLMCGLSISVPMLVAARTQRRRTTLDTTPGWTRRLHAMRVTLTMPGMMRVSFTMPVGMPCRLRLTAACTMLGRKSSRPRRARTAVPRTRLSPPIACASGPRAGKPRCWWARAFKARIPAPRRTSSTSWK